MQITSLYSKNTVPNIPIEEIEKIMHEEITAAFSDAPRSKNVLCLN